MAGVLRALGFADPDRAVRQHCLNPTKWRVQNGYNTSDTYIIREPDLYRPPVANVAGVLHLPNRELFTI